MRIGVVSDIHGDHDALSHAIALMGPVDRLFCVGDAINQHRFSNEVVALLRQHNVETIWGNHEAEFFSPASAKLRAAAWIDPAELSWLEARPTTLSLELAGRKLLLVHSTPGQPFGNYVSATGGRFEQHFAGTGADLILCGHTHQPHATRVGDTLVLNPGSLGEGRPGADGYVMSCAAIDLATMVPEHFDFTL